MEKPLNQSITTYRVVLTFSDRDPWISKPRIDQPRITDIQDIFDEFAKGFSKEIRGSAYQRHLVGITVIEDEYLYARSRVVKGREPDMDDSDND